MTPYLLLVIGIVVAVVLLQRDITSNRRAIRAVNEFRVQRLHDTTVSFVKLCRSQNQLRILNNHIHDSLVRSVVIINKDITQTSGQLRALLVSSLITTRNELKNYPKLKILSCSQLPSVKNAPSQKSTETNPRP